MIWLNELTALPALAIWLLVFIGFRPHLRFSGEGPLHHMVRGVAALAAVLCVRFAFWDVIRPALRVLGYLPHVEQSVLGALVNGSLNSLAAVGGYMMLIGLQQTLPLAEQKLYPPWRAPFYPRGVIFFRRDK